MPVMNGFELCRRIKTDAQLRHIPFIFYTATFVDQRDEELAMSLGPHGSLSSRSIQPIS
jgi:CheY-like chemotaxis protein